LGIGVLGYIGIFQHKEHPPEFWYIPPGTPVYSEAVSCKAAHAPEGYVVPILAMEGQISQGFEGTTKIQDI
jgi:hypothetical protein